MTHEQELQNAREVREMFEPKRIKNGEIAWKLLQIVLTAFVIIVFVALTAGALSGFFSTTTFP